MEEHSVGASPEGAGPAAPALAGTVPQLGEGVRVAVALAEALGAGFLVLTPDLRVLFGNDRFYQRSGVDRSGAAGRSVLELGWNDPELLRYLESPNPEVGGGVEVPSSPEGGGGALLLKARRLDTPPLLLVTLQDVVRAPGVPPPTPGPEDAAFVLDQLPQGIFWKDLEGRFLGVNAVAARASGFESPREVVGLTDHDLPGVTPEQAEAYREKDQEVMRSGEPVLGFEEPMGLPDGSTAWLRTSKVPLRDGAGRVVGVAGTWEDVTDRKTDEKRLRQHAAAFRQLADAMPQLVWMATPDGHVDYYNRRVTHYDGITLQAGSWEWSPVVHPNDAERTTAAWRRAVAMGEPYEVEHRIRMADQTYRWHLSRGVPAFAGHGRVARWYGTATDIHALKTAEEALRVNEERLRRAQEAAHAGTWDWDLITGEVIWSEGVFALVGLPPESGVPSGEEWQSLLHPADRERVARSLEAVIEGGDLYENEFRVVRADGRVVWLAARGRVLRDEGGRPYRLLAVNFDVTPRKEAEEALRRLNETLEARVAERTEEIARANRELVAARDRFRTAFHASPIAACIVTLPGGRLLDVNAEYARFFEVGREELLAGPNLAVRFWADSAEQRRLVEEVREEGRVRNREVLVRTADGAVRTVLASVEPIELDEARCALAMFVDITERKRAEAQVRELATAISLAEQRERQRLSEVLHDDLQQILVGARMRMAALPTLVPEVEERVKAVRDILARALEVTRSLAIELNPPILEGEELAPALRWLTRHMEELHGLHVELDVSESLQLRGKELRALTLSVVRELLFNVVKHAGTGCARLACHRTEDGLVVVVEDDGAGFDPSAVFGDSTHRASLGLFSVEERMRLVGGALHVDSRPGSGTRVTLELPGDLATEPPS